MIPISSLKANSKYPLVNTEKNVGGNQEQKSTTKAFFPDPNRLIVWCSTVRLTLMSILRWFGLWSSKFLYHLYCQALIVCLVSKRLFRWLVPCLLMVDVLQYNLRCSKESLRPRFLGCCPPENLALYQLVCQISYIKPFPICTPKNGVSLELLPGAASYLNNTFSDSLGKDDEDIGRLQALVTGLSLLPSDMPKFHYAINLIKMYISRTGHPMQAKILEKLSDFDYKADSLSLKLHYLHESDLDRLLKQQISETLRRAHGLNLNYGKTRRVSGVVLKISRWLPIPPSIALNLGHRKDRYVSGIASIVKDHVKTMERSVDSVEIRTRDLDMTLGEMQKILYNVTTLKAFEEHDKGRFASFISSSSARLRTMLYNVDNGTSKAGSKKDFPTEVVLADRSGIFNFLLSLGLDRHAYIKNRLPPILEWMDAMSRSYDIGRWMVEQMLLIITEMRNRHRNLLLLARELTEPPKHTHITSGKKKAQSKQKSNRDSSKNASRKRKSHSTRSRSPLL